MHPHLALMGIDRWTRRERETSVLPACYAYELLRKEQCVGILFAIAEQDDPAIAALLEKIIVALQCVPRGQWYFTQPAYDALSDLRFVITLGEGFEVKQEVLHIHSHAPQRLITEPKLKAETWKALQTIFLVLQ